MRTRPSARANHHPARIRRGRRRARHAGARRRFVAPLEPPATPGRPTTSARLGGLTELLGEGRPPPRSRSPRPPSGRSWPRPGPGGTTGAAVRPTEVSARAASTRPEEAARRDPPPEGTGALTISQVASNSSVGSRILAAEQRRRPSRRRDRAVLAVEHLRHPHREAADRAAALPSQRRGRAGTRPAVGTPRATSPSAR